MENERKRPDTVNHLLDIESHSGVSDGRTWKIVIYVACLVAPLVLLLALVGVVNIRILIFIYIIYCIRITLLIPLEERKRVSHYKQQLYNVYSSVEDIIEYTIDDDGCIRYFNNEVAYAVRIDSGENKDNFVTSAVISKFIEELGADYDIDITINNDNGDREMSKRYNGMKMFTDEETSSAYMKLIDHIRRKINQKSKLTSVTVLIITKAYNRKELYTRLDGLVNIESTRAFKGLKMLDKIGVSELMNRDLDTYIDFDNIMKRKYATGVYHKSRVLGYDIEEETKEEDITKERGFIPNA